MKGDRILIINFPSSTGRAPRMTIGAVEWSDTCRVSTRFNYLMYGNERYIDQRNLETFLDALGRAVAQDDEALKAIKKKKKNVTRSLSDCEREAVLKVTTFVAQHPRCRVEVKTQSVG